MQLFVLLNCEAHQNMFPHNFDYEEGKSRKSMDPAGFPMLVFCCCLLLLLWLQKSCDSYEPWSSSVMQMWVWELVTLPICQEGGGIKSCDALGVKLRMHCSKKGVETKE